MDITVKIVLFPCNRRRHSDHRHYEGHRPDEYERDLEVEKEHSHHASSTVVERVGREYEEERNSRRTRGCRRSQSPTFKHSIS